MASLLATLAPWLVTYVSMDALLAVGAGALTGCGRQGIGGRFALLSYVAIGAPLALLLAFRTPLAVEGLVAGHTLGKFTMMAAIFVVVLRTEWHAESEKALTRVKKTLATPVACTSTVPAPAAALAGGEDEATGGGAAGGDAPMPKAPPTLEMGQEHQPEAGGDHSGGERERVACKSATMELDHAVAATPSTNELHVVSKARFDDIGASPGPDGSVEPCVERV